MLQQNERFIKDVARYNEIIDKLPNAQEQLQARKLLNDLIYEVKALDAMYVDMAYGKQLSTVGTDIREKISSVRKHLEEICLRG